MSNNKRSMKLYTEEQLTELLKEILKDDFLKAEDIIPTILGIALTPIELPSDEEVEKYLKSFPYTKHLDDGQYNDGVIVGAELAIEWMRDKIQGGNNEQRKKH